ncbi:MAG: peptidylprolyl isomerase [Gammaproteobacteria bacterium]|nr:peptidylprolyl isomerase [Gammaproteobacteria bacterium]
MARRARCGLTGRAVLQAGLLAVSAGMLSIAAAAETVLRPGVFASVDGVEIAREEFEVHVETGLRQRLYHGHADAARLAALRREIGEQLIEQRLLLREARRRGLKVDRAAVEAGVQRIEARYRDSAGWRSRRQAMLASLRDTLEQDDLIRQLKDSITTVALPDERQLRAWYAGHADRFTTPERQHVALILLKVEPWAPAASWQAALDEGQRLRSTLAAGADFAALARLHSADPSAQAGGDLGFVHRGMLADEAQQVVDRLHENEVSAPVRLLQGVALFRLLQRAPAHLNPFEQVSERARGLWQREQAEQAWQQARQSLRRQARVVVDEAAYAADNNNDKAAP